MEDSTVSSSCKFRRSDIIPSKECESVGVEREMLLPRSVVPDSSYRRCSTIHLTLLRVCELGKSNSQIPIVELSVNIFQEDVTDYPETCWT